MANNYSDQQKLFVEIFLDESRTNPNYNDVAKLARTGAGYSETTKVAEIMAGVKELIIDQHNLRLVMMIPKLMNGLEDAVDNPAKPGVKNLLSAVMTGLDRAGIIKKEESTINIKTPDGILILPSKNEVSED